MSEITLPNLAAFSKSISQMPAAVNRTISPRDEMFAGNAVYYFYVGHSALRAIYLAMLAVGKTDLECILDLPCGHGRVLRWLRVAFPNAVVTACDIDGEAVEFCAGTFKAHPVPSASRLDEVILPHNYDLIWCGSLLTHLGEADWMRGLGLFARSLKPGGLLVFTTHGQRVAERLRAGNPYMLDANAISRLLTQYGSAGFGFQTYAHADAYGVSVCTPGWVCERLQQFPALQIVHLHERGWAQHQDVFACVRTEPLNA
jgi:SAM-dependent methyltransferase